jgi:hypothetical protein
MAPQGGIEFIDITINKGQRVGKNGGGSSSCEEPLFSPFLSSGKNSKIEYKESARFDVDPDTGYVAQVEGCGGTLMGDTYTTGPVSDHCTVTASFAAIPTLRVCSESPC